jgi:short-subunit dehydrogenase
MSSSPAAIPTACNRPRARSANGTAAFDAADPDALERFFRDLPAPIDHVMVTAGQPHYGPLADMDFAEMREALDDHLMLALQVARGAGDRVRPGGTLVFMGGTGARRPAAGLALASTQTVALPALIANLALELAPVRVNLIAAGFVDRRSRRRFSAISSKSAARNFATRFRSGASSCPPMSPRSRCTS